MSKRDLVPLALLLAAACGGVSSELTGNLPEPRTAAVLPLAGPGPLAEREIVRALLVARLRVRNIAVAAPDHVDRVLTEKGWLADPATFDAAGLDLGAVATALGVDGVITGHDVGATAASCPCLQKGGVGGRLEWHDVQGRRFWTAAYTATRTGGFVVRSGQVVAAVQEFLETGTSRAFIELAEEFADVTLDTLPEFPGQELAPLTLPAISEVKVAYEPASETSPGRLRVEVRADPGLTVTFAPVARLAGVPTVESEPGVYRGEYVRITGDGLDPEKLEVAVLARNRFGLFARRQERAS